MSDSFEAKLMERDGELRMAKILTTGVVLVIASIASCCVLFPYDAPEKSAEERCAAICPAGVKSFEHGHWEERVYRPAKCECFTP